MVSKFMFHLKFSSTEDFVNEHELYEVIRSRNLYQNQFSVKLNYRKTMRNIQIAERAERYGFENTRKLFVQRMRERREQADKLRLITSSLKPEDFEERKKKKKERRYVPIPQSTTIYSEFPAIAKMEQANSPAVSVLSEKSHDRALSRMSLPVPPTPSVIAATMCTDDIANRENYVSPMKALCQDRDAVLPTKALVVGRGTPTAVVKVKTKRDSLVPVLPEIQKLGGLSKEEEEFVKKTKRGRGKMHVSTSRITDGQSDDQRKKKASTQDHHTDSTEKCEQWREKHALIVSKDATESTSFKRLMIDRPSKFTLSHVQNERLLDAVDIRYRMIQKLARELDKDRPPGQNSDNLDSNTDTLVTLPKLDAVPKPMVTMDPGGTTPDGRLILTKADYDEYLAGYRKAREHRLKKAQRHEQDVGKMVTGFTIHKDLRLRETSRVKNGIVLRPL